MNESPGQSRQMSETGPDHALLRWWQSHVVGSVDHASVVARIREDDGWSAHFAFMTMMSAAIAVLGLLLSSPAVVIGAMLISPLMGPIIGLGFGVATFDSLRMRRALYAIIAGTGMAIAFCALVVWLSPLQTVTDEIAARTHPNLFDLLVALFSGLAGTYAMIRGRQGAIVGVAIATALMPPIAVVGFGLATGNWTVLAGSFLLFFTNLMTITAAAAVLARIYGFAPDLSPQQTRLQAVLVVLVLFALAVPLALSLKRIAWEALASREAREAIADRFGSDARLSDLDIDFQAQPIEISATVLTPKVMLKADRDIAADLAKRIGAPVGVEIDQVRIGAGNSEAIELAAAKSSSPDKGATRIQERIMERLALIAGVSPDEVLIDAAHKRAQVRAALLPGARLDTYRELEARVALAAPNWTVILLPPPVDLPSVTTAKDAILPEGDQAVAVAAWAAQRLHLPIGVSAARKIEAEAVAKALLAAGAEARVTSGNAPVGAVALRWLPPGETQARQ